MVIVLPFPGRNGTTCARCLAGERLTTGVVLTGKASSNEWSGAALSPESGALLAVARTVVGSQSPRELSSALGACESVEGLCEAARSQGMLGHLAAAVLRPGLDADPGLRKKLMELQRALVVRNLKQTTYLVRILDKLEEAGVQAMPLRGPIWAEMLYGDIASRIWVDLDLLVEHDRLSAAHDALLAWGLTDTSPLNRRTMEAGWGSSGQIALARTEFGLVVDLHWKITVSTSPRSLTAKPVLARGENVELLGRQVRCPGKSDVLVMTCMEGARDKWGSLSRLLDLAVQVSRMREEEWPGALKSAGEAGCERRMVVGVAHVCRVLRIREPEAVTAASRDMISRMLARRLRPENIAGDGVGTLRERLGRTVWDAASEDNLVDGVRHLAARLFAPSTEDWQSYRLPPGLALLYRLLRPGRLAVKWSARGLGLRRARKGD